MTSGTPDSRDERLGRALGEYIDRLCAGEDIDRAEIETAHPDLAEELIEELETLRGLGAEAPAASTLEELGRHRILREVGRGGMGVVYEAFDDDMERHVALKVLPREFASQPRLVARFVKEAKVAGKLSHPSIVPVFGMGIDRGIPFFSMEFVEGKTLAELLRQSGSGTNDREGLDSITAMLAPREARPERTSESARGGPVRNGTASSRAADTESEATLSYCIRMAEAFAGVADGLAHAHARGVVHRDIKPSNLIVDATSGQLGPPRLRILDFGLARIEGQESLTLSGDVVGTVLYMSPEQAMARRAPVDHRTDIYSLGASLYEVLTRTPPFRGRDHRDTISQIMFREPRSPRRLNPRVPRDLETIVLKCLSKDARDRYSTAEALAQDLRRFARGDPIEARPLASWERLGRLAWRKKTLLTSAIAVVLLVATSLLLLAKYREEELAGRKRNYDAGILDALMLIEYAGDGAPRLHTLHDPHEDRLGPSGRTVGGEIELLAARDPIKRALEVLDGVTELMPERPEAAFHRARALIARGRKDEARAVLASAGTGFAPSRILLELHFADEEPSRPQAPAAAWEAAYARAARASFERRREEAIAAYTEFLAELEVTGEPYLGCATEAWLARGRAHFELGEIEMAIADFAFARARHPAALEPCLLLARTFLRKGQEAAAKRELDRLWRTTRFRPEVAGRAVEVFLLEKDYPSALAWSERIEDETTRDIWRALCRSRQEQDDEAIAIAARLKARFPDDFRSHHTLGTVLFSAGRDRDAVVSFREAVRLADDSPRCWKSLGDAAWRVAYYSDEDYSESISALTRATELAPRDPEAFARLAHALRNAGKLDEAETRARTAIALDPRSLAAMNSLALVSDSRGKNDDAVDWYTRALAIEPESAILRTNLAWSLCLLKRYDEALEMAEAARALRPDDPEMWKILGNAHFFKGEYDEARDAYAELVERVPRHATAHYNLGTAYEALDDKEKAIESYRHAVELAPGYFRAAYNLGNVYASLERYEDAIATFKQGLEHSDHPWLWFNLADAQLKAGRLDEAAKSFAEAIERDPDDPESYASLATVREKQGAPDEAKRLLEKALEKLGEPSEATAKLREDVTGRLERLRGEAR